MKHTKLIWLVSAFLIGLLALGLGASVTRAAPQNIITVNSTDDTYIPNDGKCTLREAINNANNDSNVAPNSSPDCVTGFGADVIVLSPLTNYLLDQADSGVGLDKNGMPVITSDITINGQNSNLTREDGAPSFRIFRVNETGKLTLNNLNVSGGKLLAEGAGIYNMGILVLNNVTVISNSILSVSTADEGLDGGGIYNRGQLTFHTGTVYGNASGDGGKEFFGDAQTGYKGGDGGGIYNAPGASATLENVTVSHNRTGDGQPGFEIDHNISYAGVAGYGGGIYSEGVLEITRGYISVNQTGADACGCYGSGGGLAILGGIYEIKTTWLTANNARDGGGMYVEKGSGDIFQSLFYANSGLEGVAIFTAGGDVVAGTANLYNTTIANNSASMFPGVSAQRSIIRSRGNLALNYATIGSNIVPDMPESATLVNRDATGILSLNNSLVAYTSDAPDCYHVVGAVILNLGGNIENGDSCDFNGGNGGMSNTDPKLFALADNGGPTWTMALASDSPARDFGNQADCTHPFTVNNLDQRGYPRIEDTNTECDSGAYEYGARAPVVNPTATNTPTVTPTNVLVTPTATKTNTPGPSPTPTNTNTPTPSLTPTITSTPEACPTAPAAPSLVSPSNNTVVEKARVKLKWSIVTCALSYNVSVQLKTTVVDSATGLLTNKFKTKALTKGKTYRWFVEACNTHGCTKSTTKRFTVN